MLKKVIVVKLWLRMSANKKENDEPFSFLINFWRQVVYLPEPIFASILSVACGTARNRALSINLPVTRQMP